MANEKSWPQDLLEIFSDSIFDEIKIADSHDTEVERLKATLQRVSIWIKEKGRYPDEDSINPKEIEIYENLQALKLHIDVLKEFDVENILN